MPRAPIPGPGPAPAMPTEGRDVLGLHRVSRVGSGPARVVLVHGLGCNQDMWRHVAPSLAKDHEVVLLDLAGFGRSDRGAFDPARHATLAGHAEDLVAVARALGGGPVHVVGHSVSAMIAVLASILAPERFASLVLLGPSPRYVDEDGYQGGFSRQAVDGLLALLDENPELWSRALAPVVIGRDPADPSAQEFVASSCAALPEATRALARATFLGDNRGDLARVPVPTLVVQCAEDRVAPDVVGEYVARRIPRSRLVRLKATGHCPHLTSPDEVATVVRGWLADRGALP